MISKIATLITSYNRKDKTLSCLKALFNCDLPDGYKIEVFLVDDGSNDGTGNAVKEKFPQVNVIQGNGNLYWNGGMHLAWQTATKTGNYDFYLWLNDDVILFPNSLLELLNVNSKKTDTIVCGTLCSATNKEITYGGNAKKGSKLVPNGKPQECYTFNGNVILVPRNVYRKVGNLDPIFPHAIGDYDYALRAREKGIKSFITCNFIGFCEKNISLPKWCLPEVSFSNRLRSLYSPLGNSHPFYYFIYEKRHYGLLTSLKHSITIHLRLVFPKLWLK